MTKRFLVILVVVLGTVASLALPALASNGKGHLKMMDVYWT